MQAPAAQAPAAQGQTAQGTTAQLNYGLNNPDAPGTIYVSTDVSDNQITLVMSSTVAASFSAGTLVTPAQASSGTGSLLYLELTPLGLTAAEFNALTLVAEGWTSALYSGASGQYVGFTPTAAVSLQPAPATITLALDGFALAQAPGSSASLQVLAYRVGGVTTSNSFPILGNISVVFQVPDDNTGDLTTAMQVALTPSEVVTSNNLYPSVANQIVLTFTQDPNAPVITADSGTAFTLNFVYADDANGYGALLTVAEGEKVTVTAAQGTTDWTITPNPNANPPFWTLTPPAGPLFTEGAGSTLAFDIGALVTTFQPGPTVALIGYSGVKGYKPGSFAATIVKEPHVVINSFQVSPPQSTLTNGSATVQLTWSTSYATQLTLQPLGVDVTGKSSYSATIGGTTQFTLVAEGQRPGNVDNVASSSVTAQVLPVINGFTATPESIYVGDFGSGYRTTLAWNVNTNDQVTLTSSTTGPVGPAYPPISSATLSLQTPQLLTLTPQGGSEDPTVSRSLIVSGFQVAVQTASINQDSGYCAAPPNAGFVAVTSPSGNLVSILSTANYFPITTVPVGHKPLGVAFSPDGALMYVANSSDGTVSIFTVANVAAYPAFTFTPAGTVTVGGAPQQLAVGPDGTCWVTIDKGATTAGQLVAITQANGSFTAGTPLTVGVAPRGVAVSSSGASIYVANSVSGTISIVTIGGSTPAVGTLLSGIGGPVAIALTPDGKKFLVAASGDGAVYGYNTQFAATSPRQTYALPGANSVAASPSGDYAIATGSGPNTVALLNYANATIPTTSALSATPLSAAFTPEGELCIIALPGSNAVGVVTLAEYAEVAATTAAGGLITNVALSPDNKTVVGWYDAAITVMAPGHSPIKGLLKGSVSGAAVSPYISDKQLNGVAISPAVADDAIYTAVHGAAEIDVYKLSTMAPIATIPIPLGSFTSRQAVAAAVSSDGGTLFALVSNGANQYSFVVFSADVATKAFNLVSDVVAFTALYSPLTSPFAIGVTSNGVSAYAIDTTTAKLWTLSGSGGNWSVGAGLPLATGVGSAIPNAFAVSPDGSTGYVSIQAGTSVSISVIDLAAQTANLVHLPNSSSITNFTSLAVSADGQSLYASDAAAAAIRVLSASSLRIDQTLSWTSGVLGPWGIAAASDGTGLFSANINSQNIAIAQQVNPT
jgi:DNA-binding beta-propeller fold protein YncE